MDYNFKELDELYKTLKDIARDYFKSSDYNTQEAHLRDFKVYYEDIQEELKKLMELIKWKMKM